MDSNLPYKAMDNPLTYKKGQLRLFKDNVDDTSGTKCTFGGKKNDRDPKFIPEGRNGDLPVPVLNDGSCHQVQEDDDDGLGERMFEAVSRLEPSFYEAFLRAKTLHASMVRAFEADGYGVVYKKTPIVIIDIEEKVIALNLCLDHTADAEHAQRSITPPQEAAQEPVVMIHHPTAESTEISITNEASERTIPSSRGHQGVIPINPGAPVEWGAGNDGAIVIDSGEESTSPIGQKSNDGGSKGSTEEIEEDARSWKEVDAISEGVSKNGRDDSDWAQLDEADDI
ncbi:hypothetical protein G7Y79_00012g032990 [Physcia stellaris]|nr:hypothetical protein G7Y79_00012g032990 [Physcia stellaris]